MNITLIRVRNKGVHRHATRFENKTPEALSRPGVFEQQLSGSPRDVKHRAENLSRGS
jgi:hypothetical protein